MNHTGTSPEDSNTEQDKQTANGLEQRTQKDREAIITSPESCVLPTDTHTHAHIQSHTHTDTPTHRHTHTLMAALRMCSRSNKDKIIKQQNILQSKV